MVGRLSTVNTARPLKADKSAEMILTIKDPNLSRQLMMLHGLLFTEVGRLEMIGHNRAFVYTRAVTRGLDQWDEQGKLGFNLHR